MPEAEIAISDIGESLGKKTEFRIQKAEGRRQKAEGRRQKAEDGRRKTSDSFFVEVRIRRFGCVRGS
jgi:hypothetical protein